MNESPCVSVIIPVYNGSRFLAQAVESIRIQGVPVQIIVVDDGSTDDTPAVCDGLGDDVLVIHHAQNQGAPQARNSGLDAATCDLIAFLDNDDLWLENKLHLQIDYLTQHPNVQYVLGYMEYFLESGSEIPPSHRAEWFDAPQPGWLPSTFLGRKSIFESVGHFDPTLPFADDVDWFARANDMGVPVAVLDQVLIRKRVHDTNLTLNADQNNLYLLRVLKNSLERKRKNKAT